MLLAGADDGMDHGGQSRSGRTDSCRDLSLRFSLWFLNNLDVVNDPSNLHFKHLLSTC